MAKEVTLTAVISKGSSSSDAMLVVETSSKKAYALKPNDSIILSSISGHISGANVAGVEITTGAPKNEAGAANDGVMGSANAAHAVPLVFNSATPLNVMSISLSDLFNNITRTVSEPGQAFFINVNSAAAYTGYFVAKGLIRES